MNRDTYNQIDALLKTISAAFSIPRTQDGLVSCCRAIQHDAQALARNPDWATSLAQVRAAEFMVSAAKYVLGKKGRRSASSRVSKGKGAK